MGIASLIISVIILIVVVILIFMVCYYYSTNNNSTKSIQNPQALAAAALYKYANKDNFRNSSGCGAGRALDCCVATNGDSKIFLPGTCTFLGNNCDTAYKGKSCDN